MDSPFLGMIQYFACDFTPKGYLNCNGALLPIQQNAALFSLLGTYYGGNGQTNFALPDLRGRSIVGQGNNHTIGEKFGTPTATMLTVNMPAHTHSAPSLQTPAFTGSRGGAGNANVPTGAFAANPTAGNMYTATPGRNEFLGTPSVTVGVAGSGVPFNTQNPYLALTACIASNGIFPSRN